MPALSWLMNLDFAAGGAAAGLTAQRFRTSKWYRVSYVSVVFLGKMLWGVMR